MIPSLFPRCIDQMQFFRESIRNFHQRAIQTRSSVIKHTTAARVKSSSTEPSPYSRICLSDLTLFYAFLSGNCQ